jgi:hypothetical protein
VEAGVIKAAGERGGIGDAEFHLDFEGHRDRVQGAARSP